MIPILSLLIFVPIAGSAVSYAVTRWNRNAGIAVTLIIALAVLTMALYVFGFVYEHVPTIGNYALTEKYTWITTTYFSVDYFQGVDGLSSPLVLASALLVVFVVIGSRKLITTREPLYYALVLLFEGTIIGVFTSLNLILFYVFWELVLIPMFFFIGIWGGDRRKYAAMKFMIYVFAGSTVMLLSLLAAYFGANAQSFDITALAGKIPPDLQYLPLLASFIGFGIKLPVVPLHSWLPDAYVQAPSPSTVLLSGAQAAMGGYGIIRISIGLFPDAAHQWAWGFIALGALTMFYGAIVAIRAKGLKSMFAFTSLNHMGFVVFGAFATVLSGNSLGVEGAILQMFVHAFTAGSLFMLSGFVQQQAGTGEIASLRGLSQTMPRTAGLLVVASAGAMALPPFASFLAELMIIVAGIDANVYLAIVVLVPVITGGYLLWMIKRVILSPAPEDAPKRDMSSLDFGALLLYIVPLVLLLVFSLLILTPAAPVAQWVVQLTGGT
jgi:NADH-quinone oxidoreductase subunit M